ncbi:carbohydrate ABC transporter permease [Streptacidiphilus neutrinimicus]|uniref:carbohydrate ABC transporter permease n=1 Tax=Streptacidiphilus neutrinimicus TaxID=105420 RepID=UPI0005A8AF16|nr:sugar ABC transporter permease [Streptacidiphilus neutrinimicus]
MTATTTARPALATGGRRPRRRAPARDFRTTRWGWAYSAPAVLIFAAFVIVPTGYTFYVSLWKWNALNPAMSVYRGLGNYQRLFDATQPTFLSSLWHSLYFSGAMVVGGTALSLALALLLQRGGALLNASRVALFLPHATPMIATSMIWVWIFNPRFGLADWMLHSLHLPTSQWLQSSTSAMPAVIVYSLWHEVGFTTVVFLGGLAVLPNELSEAARMDGCSAWQEFWHITWHQLRPVTVFVVAITAITSLQAFTQFYQLSDGGPVYATTTLSYLVYQEAFVLSDTGYGAALAVVLFAVTVFFTLVRRRTATGADSALT